MPHPRGTFVSIRQILLVPHTPHDVGYTNGPRVVDRLHQEIVGEGWVIREKSASGNVQGMSETHGPEPGEHA